MTIINLSHRQNFISLMSVLSAPYKGGSSESKPPNSGKGFETYIFHELRSYSDYWVEQPIHHWRSASGFEVDFILADHTAIEVKAKENVSLQDLKSLRALSEEKKWKRLVCVSLEKRPRTIDNVQILPYRDFLEMLWSDAFN